MVIKRDQFGQVGLAFSKCMMVGSDPLVVLYVLYALKIICSTTAPSNKVRLTGCSSPDLPSDLSDRWVSHWPTCSYLGPSQLTRTEDKWCDLASSSISSFSTLG